MKIILIHGLAATKKSNWFPWLEKTVYHNLGLSVQSISLPHSKIPNSDKWLGSLNKEIRNPDENTFFIAHSLGCITLLKYIEGLPDTIVVGGVILISAFDETLPLIPLINSFVDRKPVYHRIIPKVRNIKVIGSSNDIIVPLKYTKKVAAQLRVPVTEIQSAGHFTSQDGYKSFAELYSILVKMINAS
jgi:predicted alpha/beta hydrolase family esterase